MKFLVLFLCFCLEVQAGEVIKIGLFHHKNISGVDVTILSGSYELIKNDRPIKTFSRGEKMSVSHQNGALIFNHSSLNTSSSTKIELVAKSAECLLLVKPKTHKTHTKITGHLSFWNRGKKMSVINTQDLDTYIAGVVEAESGSKQNREYYKVQSVICRTYALANKSRHSKSGFHLCDEVHCQVYHGLSESNPEIIRGTLETSDVVVVDQDINLITTAFHSNCGGQTINSEDVWSEAVPYLKAVKDTFCLDMPHAEWDKSIKTVHWMGFLKKNSASPEDSAMTHFSFKHDRTHLTPKIHLKDIRSQFNLKSTYFNASEKNGLMNFTGRGFGHGVGLCQEGAMKMSTLGFNYIDILHFYFSDIHVVPLSKLHLFKD